MSDPIIKPEEDICLKNCKHKIGGFAKFCKDIGFTIKWVSEAMFKLNHFLAIHICIVFLVCVSLSLKSSHVI